MEVYTVAREYDGCCLPLHEPGRIEEDWKRLGKTGEDWGRAPLTQVKEGAFSFLVLTKPFSNLSQLKYLETNTAWVHHISYKC